MMIRLDITPPEKGEIRALASDLYWARFTLPFRLNHINLYLLDTNEGWVIIDSGINTPDTAAQWDALLAGPLAGQRIDKIIITHHHVDILVMQAHWQNAQAHRLICQRQNIKKPNGYLTMMMMAFRN